eukprot:gene48747-59686_t
MELVWVNSTSSTNPIHHGPPLNHSPTDAISATAALMQQTARREGVTPQELADRNSSEFQKMAVLLNASNDDFIRTTEKRHHEASQDIWVRMGEAGDLYKDSYAGWYSVRDEAYYQENETELR